MPVQFLSSTRKHAFSRHEIVRGHVRAALFSLTTDESDFSLALFLPTNDKLLVRAKYIEHVGRLQTRKKGRSITVAVPNKAKTRVLLGLSSPQKCLTDLGRMVSLLPRIDSLLDLWNSSVAINRLLRTVICCCNFSSRRFLSSLKPTTVFHRSKPQIQNSEFSSSDL